MRTAISLVLLVCLGNATIAPAHADIPEIQVTMTTAAPGVVSVYTLPSGGGQPLNACFLNGATLTDATITVTLWYFDEYGVPQPIFLFPREDMWLATTLGGLVICVEGSCADANTDMQGQTTFSHAIRGGGAANPDAREMLVLVVNGSSNPTWPRLDYLFNSADITGDLRVDLTDVVLFVNDYRGDYNYRSDFAWDDVLNLSDAVLFADGLGATCPGRR